MNISPRLPDPTATEAAPGFSVGTTSSPDTPTRLSSDAPSAASNRGAIPANKDPRQGGVGGQNADSLPSEGTDLVPQAPGDPSQSPSVRVRTDTPNLVHSNDPDDQQTEAPKRTEERAATLSRDNDIGHLITGISERPICTSGRLGDIFTGIHQVVGKVALKRLRVGDTNYEKQALRRFEREADEWRRLRHPYVLEFLGTYKLGQHLCLVSLFVQNGALLKYIGTHPDVNRVRLLCEIAEAIDYLHLENIVHGDIKAGNVLIGVDDHVLLCDFGLTELQSIRYELPSKDARSTRWQSPELWDESSTKTFASDVYAFSMTIAEVLTGNPPFSQLSMDLSVIQAVYLRNERPEKTPMESNGVSYEIAWQVAECTPSYFHVMWLPMPRCLARECDEGDDGPAE